MNPVTFNSPFESALSIFQDIPGSTVADFAKRAKTRLNVSPLIVVECQRDWKIRDQVSPALDKFNFPTFPFHDFRAHIQAEGFVNLSDGSKADSKSEYNVFVVNNSTTFISGDVEVAICVPGTRYFSALIQPCKLQVLINGKYQDKMAFHTDCLLYVTYITDTESDNKVKTKLFAINVRKRLLDGSDRNLYDAIASKVYKSLSKLACDFMNPNLDLVSVGRESHGKSLEWKQQREHFIFVHKNSPINKFGADGKVFDAGEELKRTAHSRRAHYRLLKHPRYKSKRGTLVLVRSCWVGPKEWEDASGQIYKIVDHPLNPDPKNALN